MKLAEYLATGLTNEERTAAFAAYYAQYVTPGVRSLVGGFIGLPAILRSQDEFFHDISFQAWDDLEGLCRGQVDPALLKANGETWSRSTSVCILKVAARQIVDLHTKKEAA